MTGQKSTIMVDQLFTEDLVRGLNMNIGIVSSFIDEKSGGIGVYTENLVKKLNEIDFHNNYFLIHYERSTQDIYLENSEIIIPQKSFLNKMPGSYSFWRYYTLPKELKKYK
jgi:hypothetical protein